MVSIKGIAIESITIAVGAETEVTSQYALISENDRVLAKQSVGGYNGLKLSLSPEATRKLHEFIAAYKLDIDTLLGL